MLDLKIYQNILLSLYDKMEGSSDAVSIDSLPYDVFVSKDGTKLDSRRQSFTVAIRVSFFGIRTPRMIEIIADTFGRIREWIEQWSGDICFMNHTIKSVSGENSRMEIIILFDKASDFALKLLRR